MQLSFAEGGLDFLPCSERVRVLACLRYGLVRGIMLPLRSPSFSKSRNLEFQLVPMGRKKTGLDFRMPNITPESDPVHGSGF